MRISSHIRADKLMGSVYFAIGMTLYLGCQWLLSILVVHLSGYSAAGNLSIAMSISNIFSMLSLFGVRNFQVADIRDEISSSTYVTARVVTTVVAYVGIAVFVLLSGYSAGSASVILLYCLFRVSEAAADVFHGIDQKKDRLDAVGKSHAFRGVTFVATFAVVLYFGGSLTLALAVMTAAVLPIVVFYDYPIASKLSPFKLDWNRDKIIDLIKKCLPLVIYALILTVTGFVPRYFLERFHGSEALGYYTSVATPTMIIQVAASYLFTPLIPSFSRALLNCDRKAFNRLFLRVSGLIAILAAAALILSRLFGEFALSLLFGEGILPYAYLLDMAIICTIVTAYVWFLCTILTVLKNNKGLVIANFISLVVCAVVSVPIIEHFSMQGVNYSNLIALGVNLLILLLFFMQSLRRAFEAKS